MQKYRSTMPMLLGLCLVGSTLAATPAAAALGPSGTVSPTGAVFDGDYTGVMNLTSNGAGWDGDKSDPACVQRRPTTVRIRNGKVYLQYANWLANELHYRGTVNASGGMELYHTNGDGSRSILAGQISKDVLTGQVQREGCPYSLSLAKK
jgi:hypothetical protein